MSNKNISLLKYFTFTTILMALLFSGMQALGSQPVNAENEMGVGMVPGIIRVNEPLHSGKIYRLPSLIVLNPGTVEGYFAAEVSMSQDENLKSGDFLSILPQEPFLLKPTEEKTLELTLKLPPSTEDGDYLSYVSAHRVTAVQGAFFDLGASAKVYYTVSTASLKVETQPLAQARTTITTTKANGGTVPEISWFIMLLVMTAFIGNGMAIFFFMAWKRTK